MSRALDRSKRESVPASVLLTGPSGIGKSTLLEAASAAAIDDGWLTVAARCHEIQGALPLAGAQRIARSILEAVDDKRERYAADTLESALRTATNGFDEAFLQLVNGITLDFPTLFIVDDGQWLDKESRAILEQTLVAFSNRSVALLIAERNDVTSNGSASFRFSETLRVERLSDPAAMAVVYECYPTAPPAVVRAVVQQSMAHPIDLVTLARAAHDNDIVDPAALTASVRVVVARQLDSLLPDEREFLQICALISEPISYGTLSRIWPDEPVLLRHIAMASGRYLVQEGDGLRFAHDTIAESIRQTMPIEIPYRKKVLAALMSIPQPNLSECQVAAQQAAACGDVELEYQLCLKLGDLAAEHAAFSTASDALERALSLRAPAKDDFIAFYQKLAQALIGQSRFAEATTLLQRALREAATHNVPQAVGILGAQLVVVLANSSDVHSAMNAYEHYRSQTADQYDWALLDSIASWSYVCRADEERFQKLKEAVLAATPSIPEAELRLFSCEAMLHSRFGRYPDALRSLERAGLAGGSVSSLQRMTIDFSRAYLDFFQFGTPTTRDEVAGALHPMRGMTLFATGDWDDAHALIGTTLIAGRRTTATCQMLAIDTAMAVLSDGEPRYLTEIREELQAYGREHVKDVAVPLGGWWAASLAKFDKAEAAKMLSRVTTITATALSPHALFIPLSLVIAAHRIGDAGAVAKFEEMREMWCDRNPWNLAHRDLAIGVAQKVAGRATASAHLEGTARAFDELRAPLFAAYARASAGRPADHAVDLLASLHITNVLGASPPVVRRMSASKGNPALPTAREREVAALVAGGCTNREIAENLVLSERTVEAHLSNLFNKVGVSSRTQLTAWYLTAKG